MIIMPNQKTNPIKVKIGRSRSGFGQTPTPSCTAQSFEVASSTSPLVSRITFGTVPTLGHQIKPFLNAGFQNKSDNIFGSSISSAESRFGTAGVFSFGTNNTFPGFGSVQPNNSSGQTMLCDFNLTPSTSNIFSATTSAIKFEPVTSIESHIRNGFTETTNVTFQCITLMDQYGNKSLEELRYEYYLLHNRKPKLYKADSKQKSSVVDEKVAHIPYDFSKFSLFDNCEPPKIFQKAESKFNKTFEELWKSTKATSPANEAVHNEALDNLTEMVNSLSYRIDQLELFSYQNSCPIKEKSTDLLPWILYKPKFKLTEKEVPEDLEVQRLAGVLNCVILTVSEQDRKEIELLMVLVSAWPSLPDYVKTFTYSKMEILWQALSSTIKSEEHQKPNSSPIANGRHPYVGSPIISFCTRTKSP